MVFLGGEITEINGESWSEEKRLLIRGEKNLPTWYKEIFILGTVKVTSKQENRKGLKTDSNF